MISAGETAAGAVAKYSIKKLKNAIVDIIKYEENLKKLQQKQEDLRSKERDINQQVEIGEWSRLEKVTAETEGWLKSVGELLERDEEVKELLDEQLRREQEKCCFGVMPCNWYERFKMSRTAKIKAKDIEERISHPPQQPLTLPVSRSEKEEAAAQHDYLECLESREKLVEKILDKLQDDQVDAVGVIGMGAIGKTTLAKEIANKKAKHMFDEIVMVEISEVPDIERIQDQIAEAIGLSSISNFRTIAERAKEICTALKRPKQRAGEEKARKRLLIILDNIWEKLDLDKVGIPNETTKGFSCKILLTSREKSICKVMRALDENIFEVGLLDGDEGRRLFRKKLGDQVHVNSEDFKHMEARLLKKCGGLPLAIVTLANTLRGKGLSEWQHFSEELEKPILTQAAGVYRETFSILETSFKHMDNEQKKQFLLLACLFPLGSNIPIEDLMRYGIGLGLFRHVNSLNEAMKLASSWAEELISSSLLLKDDSKREDKDDDDHFASKSKGDHVKVHDVVRAFAISIAAKEMFMVEGIPRWEWEETCKTYTAISLLYGHDRAGFDEMEFDKLQTLLLKGGRASEFTNPSKLMDTFFQKMISLKVLVLSEKNLGGRLPKSVEVLRNLRTLLLEQCTEVGDIEVVGKLKKLEVLSLRQSDVVNLPDGITNLCNLRLLDLSGCVKLKTIRGGVILSLRQLEGLYMYRSFEGWSGDGASSIVELMSLTNLNVLEMRVPKKKQLPTDDQLPSGQDHGQLLKYLDKFAISIGRTKAAGTSKKKKTKTQVPALYSRELVLEGVQIDCFWEYICLKGWLSKTELLKLEDIENFNGFDPRLVEEASFFTDLKSLEVVRCNDMDIFISNASEMNAERCLYHNLSIPFRNLEILRLGELSNLRMICDAQAPVGMFSNLRQLKLSSLPNLQSYALLVEFARALTTLDIEHCYRLEYIFKEEHASAQSDWKAQVTKETHGHLIEFCHLKTLKLFAVENLHSVLNEAKGSAYANSPRVCQALLHRKIIFPSLEKLEVSFVNKIKEVWELPATEEGDEILGTSTTKACLLEHNVYNKRQLYLRSFCNLMQMHISHCPGLESLGSPSVAAALVQLEDLSIMACKKMREIITTETDEEECEFPSRKIIMFPRLKNLLLYQLTDLKWFYWGSYQLQFPALESLRLSSLGFMNTFAGPECSTAFFHEKMEFPCLKEIYICDLKCLVEELWDATGIELMRRGRATENSSTMSNPVPLLTKLTLDLSDVIEWKGVWQIPPVILQNLSSLRLCGRHDMRSLLVVSTPVTKEQRFALVFSQLPNLEELEVTYFNTLEQVFEINPPELKGDGSVLIEEDEAVCFCGQLRRLELNKLPKLKPMIRTWRLFNSLRSLHIQGLHWKYVFSSSSDLLVANKNSRGQPRLHVLPSLEEIHIESCHQVEALIGDEDEGRGIVQEQIDQDKDAHVKKAILEFPRLKRLTLRILKNVVNFISSTPQRQYVGLHFPSLEQLNFYDCRAMQSFASLPFTAPVLSQVNIEDCIRMGSLGHLVGRELSSVQITKVTSYRYF